MDLRTSLLAAAVAIGCVVVVVARTASAPAPPVRRAATPSEMAGAAYVISSMEQSWATETTQNFPADHWSQRDDFHGREYRAVEDFAKDSGVRIEDVLRAVDDDIHRRQATSPDAPDDRYARAVPCKPRPFYD